MKTLLSQFCEEFEEEIRPLLDPLDRFSDDLSRVSENTPARTVLPDVLDVRHQLTTLADKVAGQQAYVIIFGPLKSGKSTLMNALSAAYVSEVTSLPAYPCMVYVGHSDERQIRITRYDGSVETFAELASMRVLMNKAHGELADALREVESRGEEFDPAVHMPRAIRRVDIGMPAEQLADSGAVLVDTPGLYSRMRFGYDLMTREFRDAAASAIFVVKTDNLFLEQVFDEFNELLDLFSRIFLVVNLDTTKQDLRPDGGLGPSLECKDPQQIIDAFAKFAMNAELKKAWDEGRLGIYPVDLLNAASRRMRGDSELSDERANEGSDDRFDEFRRDLTDYLNSTEYMVAFLGDSLRQADSLLGELKQLFASDVLAGLARHVESLQAERDEALDRGKAVERLGAFAWEDSFGKLREDIASISKGRIDKLRADTLGRVDTVIDDWFENDASLASLLEDELGAVLGSCRDDVIETAHGVVKTVVGSEAAGAEIPPPVNADIETVGLSLGKAGKASLDALRPKATSRLDGLDLSIDEIPVKKGLVDWLLLRSQSAVRRRLFGGPGVPDRPVPSQAKHKRLGDAGRDAIRAAVGRRLDTFFDDYLEKVSTKIFAAYVEAVCLRIRKALEATAKTNADVLRVAQARLSELGQVRDDLDAVTAATDRAVNALEKLSGQYGNTDPELLSRPIGDEGVGEGVTISERGSHES